MREIAQYGSLAIEFADGLTDEQILTDERTYLADRTMPLYLRSRVKREPEIERLLSDAHAVRGLRNLLAHGYFRIERPRTIEILSDHLPKLIEEADAIPEPSE